MDQSQISFRSSRVVLMGVTLFILFLMISIASTMRADLLWAQDYELIL